MKQSIFFLVFIIITILGYGQETDSLINITDQTIRDDDEEKPEDFFNLPVKIDPSPTAAGMVNSISTSVDMYTGKLDVNLPLYSLKSRDIEVPIGLSYSRNGIKVDEVAGWVGLGWNLNAGGAITRVMNGLPDEFNDDLQLMYREEGDLNDAYGYLHIKNENDILIMEDFPDLSDSEKEKVIERGDWMSYNKAYAVWDTKPDEFYFDFGNYSGKFVFNQDGYIVMLSRKPIKIEIDEDEITAGKLLHITVTTPDGYKYTFGDTDLESVEESSFLLNKYSVDFLYKCTYQEVKEGLINNPPLASSIYYDVLPYVINYSDYFELKTFESPSYTSTWHLKKIESPSGDIVTFSYSTPSEQISYISSIEENLSMPQFTLKTTEDGSICKYQWYMYCIEQYCNQKDFYQLYQGRGFAGHMQNLCITKTQVYHNIRKLTTIETFTGNKAEFILTDESREDLLNDNSLEEIKISEGNEELNFNFVYSYNKPTSFDTKGIVYNLGPPVTRTQSGQEWVYEFTDRWKEDEFLHLTVMGNTSEYRSNQMRLMLKKIYQTSSDYKETIPPYEFEYGVNLPARLSYKRNYGGFGSSQNQFEPTKIPPVSFNDSTGLFIKEGEEIHSDDWDCDENLPDLRIRSYGIHNLAINGNNENTSTSSACALKTIKYPTGGEKTIWYSLNKLDDGTIVPGLRVDHITNVSVHGNGMTQDYTYEDGALTGNRILGYTLDAGFNAKVNFGSTDMSGSLLTKGSYIGYEKVTLSQNNLGKTVYHFINPATEEDNGYKYANNPSTVYIVGGSQGENTFPYPPDFDKDWQRGLIRHVQVYKEENEDEPIKEIYYDYNLPPDQSISEFVYGLTPSRYLLLYHPTLGIPYGECIYAFKAGLYKYESNTLHKIEEKTIEYDPALPGNLSTAVTTTVNYEYNPFVQQIKKITNTLSNGDIYEKIYRYPIDIDFGWKEESDSSFTSKSIYLKDPAKGIEYQKDHHIYKPNEIIEKINDNIISAMLYTYQLKLDLPNVNVCLLPYQTFSLKLEEPILASLFTEAYVSSEVMEWDERYGDPDITVNSFDDDNRITEYSDEYGHKHSYLWGELNLPPTAVSDNSGKDEIAYTSFEDLDVGSAPTVYGPWKTISGSIRNDETLTGTKSFTGIIYLQEDFKLNLIDDKKYILSFWKKIPDTEWTLITEEFTKTDDVRITCASSSYRIDEVRILPSDAQMTTYTHKPIAGMTSVTDPNNNSEIYEYDELYRLKTVKDQYGNISKHYEYKYSPFEGQGIGEIQGDNLILRNTPYEYSVGKLFGAEEYVWEIENGNFISQNDNSVVAQFNGSGQISVYAKSENWISDSETAILNVNEYIPAPEITGPVLIFNPPNGHEVTYSLSNTVEIDDYEFHFYYADGTEIVPSDGFVIGQLEFEYERIRVWFYRPDGAPELEEITLKVRAEANGIWSEYAVKPITVTFL